MSTQPRKGERFRFVDPNGVPLFSDKVADRRTVMSGLPTCCLVSSDGMRYTVHKAKLLEQSKVLRGLLSDVASAAELPLQEDAATVRLLISGMYDTYSQVSFFTVRSLLELARKYDVEDIGLNCERFPNIEPLATPTLWCYLELACTFDMEFVVERCQEYLADDDNFRNLVRQHGSDWFRDLPSQVVTKILSQRLMLAAPYLYGDSPFD